MRIVPAAGCVVLDAQGRVLLLRHFADADNNDWSFPGGGVEPLESPADAAVREVFEETGLLVRLTRLVWVGGGRAFVARYPSGDEVAYTVTVFAGEPLGGELRPDGTETLEAAWFEPSEALERVRARDRRCVELALEPGGVLFEESTWSPAAER